MSARRNAHGAEKAVGCRKALGRMTKNTGMNMFVDYAGSSGKRGHWYRSLIRKSERAKKQEEQSTSQTRKGFPPSRQVEITQKESTSGVDWKEKIGKTDQRHLPTERVDGGRGSVRKMEKAK